MNISVIIPVYNAEKYIEKAIDSVLQLDEVKEVIIVEDGSPDKALEICTRIRDKEPRVKLYRHPNGENRGVGASRNLGISKATQEYIAFLDADDFYLPNRFNKDKEVFTKFGDADGVYNALGVHYYSEEAKKHFCESLNIEYSKADKFITTVNPNVNPTANNCFKGLVGVINNYGYFSLDSLTIKTSALKKMNQLFWESSMHEDTDFLVRLSYYCRLYPGDLYKAVALRGVHEENRITNNKKVYQTRLLLYKVLYSWVRENKIENKIQYHVFNNLKYFEFLVKKKSKNIFNILLYTVKHPSVFFNDQAFSTFINLSNTHRKIRSYTVKIKRNIVKFLFDKHYKKYQTNFEPNNETISNNT